MSTTITIGLDVGDRFVDLCVLDRDGAVIERGHVPNRLAALEARFAHMPRTRMVLEAGKHSPWISRALESWGHEVIVANPRRVYLIGKAINKSDQHDAETLARLGRMDPKLLRPITHRTAETQADLALLRAREALVKSRTLQINHTRQVVASYGGRLPKCSAETFPRKAKTAMPTELSFALMPVLEMVEALTKKVRAMDKEIARVSKERHPETALLSQVPGVGPVTALAYVLVLEDPRRFRTARSVGAYLGLVPRRDASGDSDPQLRITKTGDRMLRCLLVQCAQYILGPLSKNTDTDLRRYGLAICARGGKNAKKRAVVAVARKLSALLYALWTTGTVYEPVRRRARAA